MAVHGNWISGNNYLSINCITSDGDSHRDTFVFSTFGSMASRHIYGKNLDRILPRRLVFKEVELWEKQGMGYGSGTDDILYPGLHTGLWMVFQNVLAFCRSRSLLPRDSGSIQVDFCQKNRLRFFLHFFIRVVVLFFILDVFQPADKHFSGFSIGPQSVKGIFVSRCLNNTAFGRDSSQVTGFFD